MLFFFNACSFLEHDKTTFQQAANFSCFLERINISQASTLEESSAKDVNWGSGACVTTKLCEGRRAKKLNWKFTATSLQLVAMKISWKFTSDCCQRSHKWVDNKESEERTFRHKFLLAQRGKALQVGLGPSCEALTDNNSLHWNVSSVKHATRICFFFVEKSIKG